MKQLTMSYIDDDSKILLHDDHNKIVKIGIMNLPMVFGESFKESLERYIKRFELQKRFLKTIKWKY